ncbi:DUF5335 family protein [Oxalobacteraceae bacterium]|nr:DUF5335 family protein [Oxalobacteraceae bacterium]
MSSTTKLEKTVWKSYFDNVSRRLAGKSVEIEIASLDIGSQVAAAWLPGFGLTYDEDEDLLAVMAEGLDHMIRRPRDVFVETEGDDLLSIGVTDGDDLRQIIRFRASAAPA